MVRFSEAYIKMVRGEELTDEAYELLEQAKNKFKQQVSEVSTEKTLLMVT